MILETKNHLRHVQLLLAQGVSDQNKPLEPDAGTYAWPWSLAVSDADQKPGNLSMRARCSEASGVAWSKRLSRRWEEGSITVNPTLSAE